MQARRDGRDAMRIALAAAAGLATIATQAFAQDGIYWQDGDRYAVVGADGSCALSARAADGMSMIALVRAEGEPAQLLVMSTQAIFADDPARSVRLEIRSAGGLNHAEQVTFANPSGGRYLADLSDDAIRYFTTAEVLSLYGQAVDTPIFELALDSTAMREGTGQQVACLAND